MIRPDSIGNESGRRSTARLRLDFCGHGYIRGPRLKAHYYFTCRSILNWKQKVVVGEFHLRQLEHEHKICFGFAHPHGSLLCISRRATITASFGATPDRLASRNTRVTFAYARGHGRGGFHRILFRNLLRVQ